MNRTRTLFLICITLIFSLMILSGISLVQKQMNNIIITEKLTDTDPVKNVPPLIAFTTVALGSFRGLMADVLWLRAVELQDSGSYFEMVQLASWITKLQPRFAGATIYLAWNMAYNISVTCSSFEDRWRWVQRGLELIRDEALFYNPADPTLYKELGWIYQHKIGNIMDDANIFYKNQMALMYMKVFGGPDADWPLLASMPLEQKEFLAKFTPGDKFWQALNASGYTDFDGLQTAFRETGRLPENFTKALNDDKLANYITDYMRAAWLRNVYKLDPAVINRINQTYGKLDWRIPESHAIYWSVLGLERIPSHSDINLSRMITQALKESFLSGRILMIDENNNSSIITVPNLNLADSVRKTFLDAYEENKSLSFKSALEVFMKEAITILYTYGNFSKAQEYLNMLKKDYPGTAAYRVPLDEFVVKEWAETLRYATMKQAYDTISGLLYRSCYYTAYGDYEAALAHERLANLLYLRYQREQEGALKRAGLADFQLLKNNITEACLKSFPPQVSLMLRKHIEEEQSQKNKEKKDSLLSAPSPTSSK